MKAYVTTSFILLVVLVISGCGSSGPTVKDDLKKLKSHSTYAYLPNKDTISSDMYDNTEIQEVIIETIDANLKEEGYSQNTALPDVLVYVHAMFDEKVEVNADPVYTNYAYYRPGLYIAPYYKNNMYENYYTVQRVNGPRVKQIPHQKNSIVIDFIDRRTNEILWRGTSDDDIRNRRLKREIRDYIDEIFKDFP